MKVKLGDIVEGQFGCGPVVAMTEKLCVYQNDFPEAGEDAGGHIGEEWEWVKVKPEAPSPGTVESPLSEIEVGGVS